VEEFSSPGDFQHVRAHGPQLQLSQPNASSLSSEHRFDVPNNAALQGAFAQALTGPRWVHGQRTGEKVTAGQLPPTPTLTVPFPVGPGHLHDPFSRAVSPIQGNLNPAPRGFEPKPFGKHLSPGFCAALSNDGRPTHAPESLVEFRDPFNPLSTGLPQPHYYSAPDSPVKVDSQPDEAPRFGAASAPPFQSSSTMQPQLSISPTHSPYDNAGGPGAQSPAFLALTKIRKPSLRTLMSHGGSLATSPMISLAPSRQMSPVKELRDPHFQSPMLFDQPAIRDEVEAEMALDAWAGLQYVKKAEYNDEGLGMLELGSGHFQA